MWSPSPPPLSLYRQHSLALVDGVINWFNAETPDTQKLQTSRTYFMTRWDRLIDFNQRLSFFHRSSRWDINWLQWSSAITQSISCGDAAHWNWRLTHFGNLLPLSVHHIAVLSCRYIILLLSITRFPCNTTHWATVIRWRSAFSYALTGCKNSWITIE